MKKLLTMAFILSSALASAAKNARADAANLKIGEDVWQKKCQTCHGLDGKGKPAMARMFKVELEKLDLTRGDPARSPEAFVKTIADGKNSKMPAFKDKLSPAEINAVAAYAQSLGAAKK